MIKPIAVALILLTPSAYADVDLPAELKDKIEAVGINPVSAEKSPVSGIYSVFSKEGTSYVTSDGEYIFTGNLFKVKGTEVENTTDEFISKGMRSYIEKLDTITYKAPDEKYVIGVFTDITCGFCQKLHSDLQSYLDKGITIKFIAYPRAGMNPSARSTPSGSCLPLSANSGTVRHTSMVTAQHANTTRKSPQPIGSISHAPSPR